MICTWQAPHFIAPGGRWLGTPCAVVGDTQPTGVPTPGGLLTLLRSVAGMTGHPLAVPEMVLREYLGSFRRDVGATRATIAMESSDVSDRER
jgi:hypothetical protein